MFQRFYTIAAGTFLETIRQPIYGVILVVMAILMVLNVGLAAFTLADDDKLLLDLGLSTLLLTGLFLAAFTAAQALGREIESKTVLTVISKPVSRPLFMLAKYVGLVGALVVAYYLSFLVFLLAQRHGVLQSSGDPWDMPVIVLGFGGVILAILVAGFANYFYGNHFMTTAVLLCCLFLTMAAAATTKFDEHFDVIPFASNFVGGQVFIAAYLVFLSVLIMAAVALAASTRFGQMMTLVICTAVVGLGIVSDNVFGQHAANSFLASGAYHLVPNISAFYVIDGLFAESDQTAVPWRYVYLATAYSLLFSFGILNIGVAAFQRREVG